MSYFWGACNEASLVRYICREGVCSEEVLLFEYAGHLCLAANLLGPDPEGWPPLYSSQLVGSRGGHLYTAANWLGREGWHLYTGSTVRAGHLCIAANWLGLEGWPLYTGSTV